MDIDIVIEDMRWDALDLQSLANTAAEAVFAHLAMTSTDVEIGLLACDDGRIAALNTEFREKEMATNVLSWPSQDLAPAALGATPDLPKVDPFGTLELGDIAISFDTCANESEVAGKPMPDHVTHLIVHAILHLLGYDHIEDEDATLMEGHEIVILEGMGLENPYCEGAAV